MAVKIVRQPNKIALLGSPTSAAAMCAGHEGAPATLRASGLVTQLQSIGYQVVDLGDDPPQLFQADDESPRARNIPRVLASLEALKPRVEQAIKSGALPLILSGDCSIALATIAGARRYFRRLSLIYMDSDADLNTPATTPSGCVNGMVISHMIGRGAPELVRFWGEPPLVREPDLALFGVSRADPGDEEALARLPIRRYLAADVQRMGPAAAANTAIERIHGGGNEFVLHFDVNVIAGFQATNYPTENGLSLEQLREALSVFATQKHLAAIEVCGYNPTKDADGSGAKLVMDLLVSVLGERLGALKSAAPAEPASVSRPAPPSSDSVVPAASSEIESGPAAVAQGEAWPSHSLGNDFESPAEPSGEADEPPETGKSHSE